MPSETLMLFGRYLRYYLPKVTTTLRYKMSRPSIMKFSNERKRKISVFSPFLAFSLAGILGTGSGLYLNDEDPHSLAKVYELASKSVVHLKLEIKTDDEILEKNLISNGSGFIIRDDGLILTNAHVVCDMSVKSKLKIRYYDGRIVPGQVVCVDSLSDLAIVKPLSGEDLIDLYPPVEFSECETDFKVGDRVFAVGSPYGLLNTMSAGIISGINRNSRDLASFSNDSRVLYLQTDLHLLPGNSGGPIFDHQGRVIGISTVRSTAEGLSFAIQFCSINRILDQMVSTGKVKRAWLGFRGVSLNPEIVDQIDSLAKQNGLNCIHSGVLVLKSYDKSPASVANILPGDVIVAINDKPVTDIGQLLAVLDDSPIGQVTRLSVKRIILGPNGNGSATKIVSISCNVKPDEYDIFTHKELDSFN